MFLRGVRKTKARKKSEITCIEHVCERIKEVEDFEKERNAER
jgi:hypothetical protein